MVCSINKTGEKVQSTCFVVFLEDILSFPNVKNFIGCVVKLFVKNEESFV